MADVSITAANVLAGANAIIENGRAGATITAGQALYKEAATGKWKLADSNSATAEAKTPGGLALNGAADGQPLAVLKKGDITIGGTVVAGTSYYLSETAGGIQPVGDLASGELVTLIGVAKSASVLSVNLTPSGVTLAG
jgi:hypothetical protein